MAKRHHHAAAAAVLFLLCANAGGEEIGRLFYTPAERAERDELRLHPRPQPEAESPPPVINGVVRRAAAQDTVWLDGVPLDRAAAHLRGIVLGRNHDQVLLRRGARLIELPVGSAPAAPLAKSDD
ncbi:MAG: hypothetical protein KF778_19735 [Rhodocyclaceae bacterium]|nr:hypothetical protein [Rhodocyclaceae bacterium]MBX3670639.1 hypothetical protein [Rhodocyclaceae bacterium]